jgi:deoxyribodipyrimidine photo-lyase
MPDFQTPVIYWFRQDLRLSDLPGLSAAAKAGPVIPCFIFDPGAAGEWAPGGASRWWLHHSLAALTESIAERGGSLKILAGDTVPALRDLVLASGAGAIYSSRDYEPWAAELQASVHDTFGADGLEYKRYPGTLLFEPEQIATQSGQPFRVFTPFWKACLRQPEPGATRPAPGSGSFLAGTDLTTPASCSLDELGLLPRQPDWAEGWETLWQPGEAGAARRLRAFTRSGMDNYREGRDHPALETTSRLSPHLQFGEVSPREVWRAAHASGNSTDQVEKFLSELGWREFSHHLLHYFPDIPERAFRPKFADFPWLGSQAALGAWQRGQTGYPLVDAGMRELWHTGYMHNRVRMVVASFLTKHLLISWRAGEEWFWDTLVDANLANNACSWQWVAGSGADAAPYFRIFNPTAQGKKFDGAGEYVRRWVPEIAGLPDRYLHEPSAAPAEILAAAGVIPGQNYPHPIVDHRDARRAALDAYGSIKQAS